MKRRFKRPNCLAVSSIVVLSILMLVPCGIVASVNLSEKDIFIRTPFVGLYVSKFPNEISRSMDATTIGAGWRDIVCIV